MADKLHYVASLVLPSQLNIIKWFTISVIMSWASLCYQPRRNVKKSKAVVSNTALLLDNGLNVKLS